MKLVSKILQAALAVGLIGVAIWVWRARLNNLAMPTAETSDHRLARWRGVAEAQMLRHSTNDLVGFSRLIDAHIDTGSENVKSWAGDVTAERINPIGGIDRTNLHYVFDKFGDQLICFKWPQ